MKIHPLKQAYNQYILEHYGERVWGDDYERTAIVAQKVARLGLSHGIFIEVAAEMWHDWAIGQGHPYPYWNIITSNNTFRRLAELQAYSEFFTDDEHFEDYEAELEYASTYIKWMLGKVESKPVRMNGRPSAQVLMATAKCLCSWYGVPYISSNYNAIVREIQCG